MKDHTQPILTIGIIFKDEIRCLERCLKSLSPLRKALPCELIMADTGSSDGSREVAAKYADILFDFPWINDFSAARNAVMDRSTGQWHMYIDADEYLDDDISDLTHFLLNHERHSENLCAITIRNYESLDTSNRYSDFTAIRLIRMSLNVRFHGSIHEAWNVRENELQNIYFLSHAILHHDGYIGLDTESGKEKRKRNLELLRTQLKKTPNDLKTLLQYVESSKGTPEYLDIIRQASDAVEKKALYWENLGAPIFRYAVRAALEEGLPEFKKWVERAERWFPDSLYTKIDVTYMSFLYHMKHGDYKESISKGEEYLRAMAAFNQATASRNELAYSTLLLGAPYWEQDVKMQLADIYAKEKLPEHAWHLLESIDHTLLDEQQTETMLLVLGDLHRLSNLDTAHILIEFFQAIKSPVPSKEMAQKRLTSFYQTAFLAFLSQNLLEEQLNTNFCRPSYTLFLPLADKCELGLAAALMNTKDPEEIRHILTRINEWAHFPIEALAHALKCGITFPLPEQPLKAEEMEYLATQLSADKNSFFSILKNITEISEDNLQELMWVQSILLTALHIYDWEESDNGIDLMRLFAKTEQKFLYRYYSSNLLHPENVTLLPVLHRFAWYCIQAFNALDIGKADEYVHELKKGLNACPQANAIIEYMLKHTPQLQSKSNVVSAELSALAEQVKKLLASYPPNDPTVTAIKASPAYQKVAEIIENS